MRRFGCLLLAIGALGALVGCAGKTTGTTNVTSTSATLNATVRCDSDESCRWYWEYWEASLPRSTSVKTAVAGPVDGPTSDVNLSINIAGLTPGTPYRWVFCGSPNDGGFYRCVGPNGEFGSTTADPPPDYGTFTTLLGATLAMRWNGTSWAPQPTPNPPGAQSSDLAGVSCTSTSACTAAGSYRDASDARNRTLAERWNGTSWAIQTTPNPTGAQHSFLSDVSCTSATACTAVGPNFNPNETFTTLAERWNGTSWAIQPTPNPSGARSSQLFGVSCAAATACTAVGEYFGDTFPTRTLAERWNGTSWAIQTTPNPTGAGYSNLSGVSCISASACTAVGSSGASFTSRRTLAERWNGTSWVIQTTPNPSGTQRSFLTGVSCTSATACTAVGSYQDASGTFRTLAERWNGTSWTIQPTPNLTGARLNGVSCTSATACTAVGSYQDASGALRTLAERWNGTSWAIQTTPNPSGAHSNSLEGVSCSSATACTAVGKR